jgi:ParB family chromosome partitioning protein
LSDAIKAKLRDGAISSGHAKALLALDPGIREAIAERIVRDGLSVRDVERLGERRAATRPSVSRAPAKSADLEAVEARLRYALGSPVTLVPVAKGGRIEVRYSSDDDLNRILDIVAPEVS